MHRLALLLGLVLVASGCRGEATSTDTSAAACPVGTTCRSATGDVDGDGRPDTVTHWVDAHDGGITVALAGGPTVRHRFAPDVDDLFGRAGIVGVGPLDDRPGDEVVAVTYLGMAGGSALLLRWDGHDLVEVTDPVSAGPIDVGSGIDQHGSWGFSCDDGGLQTYYLEGHQPVDDRLDGEVHRYRWERGALVDAGTGRLDIGPDEYDAYAGNRCAGFHRLPWPDAKD